MKNRASLITLLYLFSIQMFPQTYNGKANPDAVIISGNARFTVLTSGIIRMEWSEDGVFEDLASLTFVNRNLPVSKFQKNESDGFLSIKTESMLLKYKINSGKFNGSNLSIQFEINGKKRNWTPGMENKGNLLGTTRTLDGVNGSADLEPGLLSREGWTFIDDSERPLFDNSEWQWVTPRPSKNLQDWYFFVYGSDYKKILKEFTEIAGKIPLPPKFAFGYWWSRYWKYTDEEFKELIDEFKIHDVPLDVLVIDMDWHLVNKPEWYKDGKKIKDQAGQNAGWTGFTWNRSVFPDPRKFLAYTDKLNLKTCLNLHPASGIQPHEKIYPEFAKAMGINPDSKKYIPFDITNKKYAENYLNLILHPMEKEGVDFWWLDWQQWSTTSIKGVNPTFYLNYVHFSDMERQNEKRPILYHRWGGLGNHRYQIGFSGDVSITWKSLDFQPYFTATASNVGYGYWSHDIGGHMDGDQKKDPELYTRWIQWGTFSPILRTHATKDPEIERRIWAYPLKYFYIMRDAIKLRYSIIPYIYTSAREAYDTGISILRPMYYDYAKNDTAYIMKNQYMFGDDMIISPITHPVEMENDSLKKLYTMQRVWLPEGDWIEWSSGSLIKGGKIVERPFCLEEIPVYIKAGAIIPMQKDFAPEEGIKNTADEIKDYLILNIFPGDSGYTKIYDDEGNNQNYKRDSFTFTSVKFIKRNNSVNLEIGPVQGTYPGMPQERSYELRFPISFPPSEVTVNGNHYNYDENNNSGSWNYNGSELTVLIFIPKININDKAEIEIKFPDVSVNELSGKKKLFGSLEKAAESVSNFGWAEKKWDESKANSDSVIWLAQTGNRITLNPSSI
ncbi:MAG TPA: TIM-barrel domain-containing protein, partial [Ignavibacteriaceae bacterium]|nr:TIM-barrel domain-containing protein [Ignavibacteriaceae bacterium]